MSVILADELYFFIQATHSLYSGVSCHCGSVGSLRQVAEMTPTPFSGPSSGLRLSRLVYLIRSMRKRRMRGSPDEGRRIAANITKLPELLKKATRLDKKEATLARSTQW
jgi:hypothetical protein